MWSVAVLAGCGDSGGDSASASNSNSESQGSTQVSASESEGSMSASMTATEPTEGGMSASGTGTTDPSGGMSDSQTMGGGSGDETEGMSGGTGQVSEGGSGGTTEMTTEPAQTTGEPIDCGAAMTKEDCLALGCMPSEAQAFESDGAIWCLHDDATFLGCLEQMICDDAITYICKGQNIYQAPSGCFPNDYMMCDAPTDPQLGFPVCM